MSVPAILAPVFAQVLLCFVLLTWLVWTGRDAQRAADRSPRAAKAAASYANQFELPVLFFALVPLALYTRKADLAFVVMSWIFVLARIAQAGVAVTTNHVPTRGLFFAFGAAVLGAMWIVFAIRIFAAEPFLRP